MSASDAGSSASTSNACPTPISRIASRVRTIGIGQNSPTQSIRFAGCVGMTSEISTLTGDAPQALVFATKADAERRSGGAGRAGPAEVRARGGDRGGQEWEGDVTRDFR